MLRLSVECVCLSRLLQGTQNEVMSAEGLCKLGKGHTNTRRYHHLLPLQARDASDRARPGSGARPEMPVTGPGRGAVPGQRCQRQGQARERCWAEQDVCAAGRGRRGSGNSAPAQSVNTHSRAKRKCSVYYPLCCVIWPAASLSATANTELITQHSSQLTQKQLPTHP